MPRLRQEKTNFTAGEISRRLLGRGDLRAYDNGALALRNLFIHPTGGVSRRAGLAYVATARGAGRLVAFEFNADQVYLLAFSDGKIDVYQGDSLIATATAPWTAAELGQITWTQSADTLLICHPDHPPQALTRSGVGAGTWALAAWSFRVEGALSRQPWFKYAGPEVTLSASAVSGSVTVTASAAVFVQGHQGLQIRLQGKALRVDSVASATQVQATVLETLPDTSASADWEEPAFSSVRGWPVSAVFHQDRLVIGGGRDAPNRLWLSRSADLWNFDTGTGLDDEAIAFGILSDQVNAVRALFSGRDLQVFTSGGEWLVSGYPLTPKNIQIKRQTRIGSPPDRTVPPRDVDGATLFVTRTGGELREFLYTLNEQAYRSTDLALLASHLVLDPVDQDFDARRRVLMVVMSDGSVGALTLYRTEEVTAWTRLETDGAFRSVAVVGDDVCFLIQRGTVWTIERLDATLQLDAALIGTAAEPTASWSGLDHLEGRAVTVVADGVVRPAAITVAAGAITLDPPATTIAAGLPFTHRIEPLPPNLSGYGAHAARARLVAVTFLVEDTGALRVDLGRGAHDLALHRFHPGPWPTTQPATVSGALRVRSLGWPTDGARGLWRLEQDAPLPFTLLSVTAELKVND